jgi:predicted HicB family RNase H-like nuclease
MSYMEYKGYLGTVEYSAEDHCLYGKLAFIRDLVNYEGETVTELEQAFEASVDHYLTVCQQQGKQPNEPLKGVFNVRTSPELHRKAVLAAGDFEMSLNAFVSQAISEKLDRVYSSV